MRYFKWATAMSASNVWTIIKSHRELRPDDELIAEYFGPRAVPGPRRMLLKGGQDLMALGKELHNRQMNPPPQGQELALVAALAHTHVERLDVRAEHCQCCYAIAVRDTGWTTIAKSGLDKAARERDLRRRCLNTRHVCRECNVRVCVACWEGGKWDHANRTCF